MKTIHFQVEDSLYSEIVKKGINVQDELKMALNKILYKKESYLNSSEFQEDKTYFHNALKEIECGKSLLLSQEDYDKEMDKFMKAL